MTHQRAVGLGLAGLGADGKRGRASGSEKGEPDEYGAWDALLSISW